eukprot:scaffold42068_cov21-Tisochrysis_lutea.AAC.1
MDNDARESKLFQLSTWGPLRKCLSTRALVQECTAGGLKQLHLVQYTMGDVQRSCDEAFAHEHKKRAVGIEGCTALQHQSATSL